MVIENATTTLVTTILPQGILGTTSGGVDNFTYLFIIVGAIVGTFLGMMIPYYRAKRQFGKEGIELLFDKDFLKVGGFALVTSVISVGALYPTLLAGADQSGSYFSVFLAAATTAFTINIGGSWIIGTNNKEAEEQLAVKRVEKLESEGKLQAVKAKLNNSGNSSSTTTTTTAAATNVE